MIDKSRIGRNVRRLRLGAGLSQTQLAYSANVSASMLEKVEGGRRGMSLDVLGALSKALNVPPGDLLL